MPTEQPIVITGGGGMLAHALMCQLDSVGRPFAALDRNLLDITNPDDVERAFERQRPAVVINCAAHTKVDLCEQEPEKAEAINGHAVATLARCAKQHNAKLVHVSTDFVFDGRNSRPYRPDDATNPLSAYGRSKLLGEQNLQSVAPPGWLIVRTAWVYGPNGANFVQTMLNAARAGKQLRVVNDQRGTPTYTFDLAEAILALLSANATGIYHVTGAGETTWYDFTCRILSEFDLHADLQPISSADWDRIRPNSAPRPGYSVLDTSAYTATTGRSLRPWVDALRAYRQRIESAPALA